MATLIGATGAGTSSTYPIMQTRAISFRLADGTTFTLPNNPVSLPQKAGTVSVDRPSLDGVVTFRWTKDLQRFTIQAVTFTEGIAPWLQFRQQFRGQRAVYSNHLTGESLTVLVTDVDLQQDGRNPANWQVTIQCKEAARFATGSPAAPAGNS